MSHAGFKVDHAGGCQGLRGDVGPVWLCPNEPLHCSFFARERGAPAMNARTPVVHVVDDDESFRKAVARLLRASGYAVVLYESGDRFLDDPSSEAPGCILLDMRMSGLSGLELQERLHQLDSILPIVFLTGYGDVPSTVRAMKAGAQDFLTKPVEEQTLLEAVERALARYRERRELHDRLNALRALVATLTPRESQVFDFVVRGRLNKQIAYDLGTSERTIKAHRQSIMHKLKVQSLAEAVSIAERLGALSGANGSPH
jgi:FixJ family two-component response regulator